MGGINFIVLSFVFWMATAAGFGADGSFNLQLTPISHTEFTRAKAELIELSGGKVRQKFKTYQGLTTSYYEVGKGPTLVLLHGAGGGGIGWFRLFDSLGEKFHVIAPDVVGYGETDKPKADYDRAYFSQWLHNFLESLGKKEIYLVGSSQGGAIALQYALDYPSSVKKLILVSSAGFGKLPKQSTGLFNSMKRIPYPTKKTTAKGLHRLVNDPNIYPDALLTYQVAIAHNDNRRVFWLGRGKAVSVFERTELTGLKAPTLLIWGEDDPIWPLDQGKIAEYLLTGSKLVVFKNSKHLPYLDQPKRLSKEIIHFLAP